MAFEISNPAIRLYLQKDKRNNIQMTPIFNTRGDSRESVNILGDDRIGNFEKNKVRRNMCLILNDYRDRDK